MKAVAAFARKNITVNQCHQSALVSAGRCKPIPELAAPSNKMSQIRLRCKICKPFHQILCIRNLLNNKLLRSQYNEIVQRKSVAVWVRFAGIWDKIQHLIMIVPWRLLVNDRLRSPKSPKKIHKPLFWRSRSFKVTEFGANRKPVYDFLLVINSNLGLISRTVTEIQRLIGQKSQILPTLLSFSTLVRGDPLWLYGKALRFLKVESSGQPMVKIWWF